MSFSRGWRYCLDRWQQLVGRRGGGRGGDGGEHSLTLLTSLRPESTAAGMMIANFRHFITSASAHNEQVNKRIIGGEGFLSSVR